MFKPLKNILIKPPQVFKPPPCNYFPNQSTRVLLPLTNNNNIIRKLFHYELFDPSKMICVRDFDNDSKYDYIELMFNDRYRIIGKDELNKYKNTLKVNQTEINKHYLYYKTLFYNDKGYFYEISDWFISNLLFYNYKQWTNSHTINVLKLRYLINEDINSSTINGQVLDSIVNLLITQHDSNNLNEIKQLLPTLSDDCIIEIVEWIKRYLFFYPNTSSIPYLLESIEIDNTKQVDKYIDNDINGNNDIYNASDEEKFHLLLYTGHKLIESKYIYLCNNFHCNKYFYNIPKYLFENLQFQQVHEKEKCLRINDTNINYSHTHKMIDLTINLNKEMIDLDLLVLEPTYYLMATLIYNYSKYIRRIKWPSNYVDFDKQEDCHSSIESIMIDLIDNRVTISQVYKWIESIELKFSEKKIWFHFNLKLDGKFIGDTEELRSITIPLVFCRGHESITCCVFSM